jgi:Leucine-rich repeat (LRR) protein
LEYILTTPFTAAGIRTLILHDMELTWDIVLPVLKCCPGLEELLLYQNACNDFPAAIDALRETPNLLSTLRMLNLEQNGIASWSEVSELCSTLPRLEKLILNGNSLTEVTFTSGFGALKAVSLDANAIESWSAVENLSAFPNEISELRISKNPF